MINMSTVAHEPEGQGINTTTFPNIGMVCKYIPLYLFSRWEVQTDPLLNFTVYEVYILYSFINEDNLHLNYTSVP